MTRRVSRTGLNTVAALARAWLNGEKTAVWRPQLSNPGSFETGSVCVIALVMALGTLAPLCRAQSARELSFPDLIELVEPSVVRIDVVGAEGEGVGSGFVVGKEGVVVTNHHVMAGANVAYATFRDNKKVQVKGTLVLDANRDIAIIQIEKGDYKPLKLAAELPIKGASVAAFGAPHGLSFSATEGIISSVREKKELADYSTKIEGTWIQTSTPISPGNSGGPLVSRSGDVVGMNTMQITSGQNLNFAISSQDIAKAVEVSKGRGLLDLSDGAAKEKRDTPITMLSGKAKVEAVRKLADVLEVIAGNSREAEEAAMLLLLIDPSDIDDKLLKDKVAKAFKRLAFESELHREIGIRGMARWGGKSSVPYFAELLEIEELRGSEAVYDVLSESDDPRAAEAIARRLGNFFDDKRALAALRRMGPAAEPGLILAVADEDFDVSLTSVKLLGEFGTEASLPILNEAVRKGAPAIRVAAREAMAEIRARQRKAARDAGK